MAYGVKYTVPAYNTSIPNYSLQISQTGFIGLVVDIDCLGPNPYTITVEADEEDAIVIAGSSLEVTLLLNEESGFMLDELMQGGPREYKIELIDNDGLLEWAGWIIPNQTKRPFVLGVENYMQLTATDGLADLSNERLVDEVTNIPLTDTATIIEVVKACIEKTDLQLDFEVWTDVYETSLMTASECPFAVTSFKRQALAGVENNEVLAAECSAALEHMFKIFSVYICQSRGKWVIKNPHAKDLLGGLYTWANNIPTIETTDPADNILLDCRYSDKGILSRKEPLYSVQWTIINRAAYLTLNPNPSFDNGTTNWLYEEWETFSVTGGTAFLETTEPYVDTLNWRLYSSNFTITVTDPLSVRLKTNIRATSWTSRKDTAAVLITMSIHGAFTQEVSFSINKAELNQWKSIDLNLSGDITTTGTYYIQMQFEDASDKNDEWTGIAFEVQDFILNGVIAESDEITHDEMATHWIESNSIFPTVEDEVRLDDGNFLTDERALQIGSELTDYWTKRGYTTLNNRITDLAMKTIMTSRQRYKNLVEINLVDYVGSDPYGPQRSVIYSTSNNINLYVIGDRVNEFSVGTTVELVTSTTTNIATVTSSSYEEYDNETVIRLSESTDGVANYVRTYTLVTPIRYDDALNIAGTRYRIIGYQRDIKAGDYSLTLEEIVNDQIAQVETGWYYRRTTLDTIDGEEVEEGATTVAYASLFYAAYTLPFAIKQDFLDWIKDHKHEIKQFTEDYPEFEDLWERAREIILDKLPA